MKRENIAKILLCFGVGISLEFYTHNQHLNTNKSYCSHTSYRTGDSCENIACWIHMEKILLDYRIFDIQKVFFACCKNLLGGLSHTYRGDALLLLEYSLEKGADINQANLDRPLPLQEFIIVMAISQDFTGSGPSKLHQCILKAMYVILRHIATLSIVNLFIDKANMGMIKSAKNIKKCYKACCKDLERTKVTNYSIQLFQQYFYQRYSYLKRSGTGNYEKKLRK